LFLVTAFQRDNNWVSRNQFDQQQTTSFDFSKLKEGDIIFQSSQSEQCLAVQLATQSVYSHCGIIYLKNGEYHVYEAVQPVKYTPLKNWIAKGLHSQFTIKRLKDAESVLTAKTLRKMKNRGNLFLNRDYDITFEWSDDKIYCSELVWKIYQRATGLRVGELQSLRDLDLSSEIVKKIMKERYGNNIPLDEIVISPVAIFESDLLELVYSNY
jgi:hypothetical protein